MVNRLFSAFQRPERGWDPVPAEHAASYAKSEWDRGVHDQLLHDLGEWLGGFSDKRILDLGAGPGQYALAFAARGADVTWYDVSRRYQTIAMNKASEQCLHINFEIGYLDEAAERLNRQFDLVFNRICWYYNWTDRSFSDVVFNLVKPGGIAYVDTTHSGWRRDTLSFSSRLRTALNDRVGIKIGHPSPPRGRIAKLFLEKPVERLVVDYSSPHNDRILFRRLATSA